MTLTWAQVIIVLLPVLVGAFIGIVPTLLVERAKQRAALRTRWDATIHTSCAQFAAAVRRILNLAEQFDHSTVDAERDDLLSKIRDEHTRLQLFMAEIRLLADVPVQLAARAALTHTFVLYLRLAGAAAAEEGTPVEARQRALASLFDFYRAVRVQLRVPDPQELAPMNPVPPSVSLPGTG
ncbi:hypothetical protein GCM10010399_75500 [Dactylosporangium fulvum]|uniref:Uncharacterized protein n=1 Tax=Dactylosporangium fulvum TaxID=53359 RepID=A0ABY5VN65_9ACTN|nr:hypothetical protein [Dactylosporangium fulvum]UWP79172.1 hypothetical protein Dfulv_28845 [Dactylosporangium fulvum]